ncbi:Glycerophosphocholine phosphodiesterase [Coemansia sp. Benny D115]|nr:Glycerophosphocholine phosphodiesterase [Coemansia sp. Benny D115]
MSVASFDAFQLGPRFYRPEFERSATKKNDIVRTIENVVKAAMDYAEDLSMEALKVSTYTKGIESMTSSTRIAQILALIEDLEQRVQGLVRYSWIVETEWSKYVQPATTPATAATGAASAPALAAAASASASVSVSSAEHHSSKVTTFIRAGRRIFSSKYLRNLDTWHIALTNAIARTRRRLEDIDYGNLHSMSENAQPRETLGMVYLPNPMHWSTEYVLEKAKVDKTKKRRPDSWLDTVPQIASTPTDSKPCTRLTDIRRRNPLHYAAQSVSDLPLLTSLHNFDQRDIRPQQSESSYNHPSICAVDLFGETPLTIAARNGNAGSTRYILNEAKVKVPGTQIVNAILAASSKGHTECLSLLVFQLVRGSPDDVALVLRMAAFYGYSTLCEMLYTALCVDDGQCEGSTVVGLEAVAAALTQAVQRAGSCSLFHLAALNNQPEMIKHLQHVGGQHRIASDAFSAHTKDDTLLTPLDQANYFGYRACADALLTSFAGFQPPIALEFSADDEALRVPPFSPNVFSGLDTPSDTYAVIASLGANDMRRNKSMPPIAIDREALNSVLDDIGLPRSTHLLLRIDSDEGMEVNCPNGYLADVTSLLESPSLSAHTWHPPAYFHTVYPDRFVLKLDLIALADHALIPNASKQKVIAQAALAIPSTYITSNSERMPGRYAPICTAGGSYLNAVFISTTSDDVIGEVNFEVFVATPYGRQRRSSSAGYAGVSAAANKAIINTTFGNGNGNGNSLAARKIASTRGAVDVPEDAKLPEMHPWLQQGETLVYGHRGSGMNVAPIVTPRRLQLGENTVLSMEKAVRDGVAAVEFDVQVTRDLVPVIYHDWIVAETGLDIPVSLLTLSQFQACNPRNRPIASSRTCEDLPLAGSTARVAGGHECLPMIVANSENTVQAPLATLQELFDALPGDVGFDIEVKYPMPDEADEFGVCTNFEINLFVDRILDVVYSNMAPAAFAADSDTAPFKRRPIVFTSFHPDICLLLAHKVNGDIPVMLLTDAGMSAMADCRCNSIDAAVRFCKQAGIAGIVTHVGPIAQSPRVASLVRRHRLALATYGALNNQADHVRQQQAYGVDVVIVDDVRNARKAVDSVGSSAASA